MLKNTLTLSDDDGQAAQQLASRIHDPNVILMIILGQRSEWVETADDLAEQGRGNGLAHSFRGVVWAKQPGAQVLQVLQGLQPAGPAPNPGVMVLNFGHQVCDRIGPGENIDALRLQEAFFKGNL